MMTKQIRKKLSLIMTLIMILSIFPTTSMGVITPVEEQKKINRANEAIDENLDHYKVKDKVKDRGFDKEYTGIEIDISKIGSYDLEYDIMNKNVPTRVKMEFDVKEDTINVISKVFEKIGAEAAPKGYSKKDIISNTWTTVTTGSSIETILQRKDPKPPIFKKEVQGAIIRTLDEGLQIRYIIHPNNPNKLLITTSGIKDGNIVNFKLIYEKEKEENVKTFEKFEKFEAVGVHLVDGIEVEHKTIQAPDKAGAKPGMKVQFKHLQEINHNTLQLEPLKNGKNMDIVIWIKDYITGKEIEFKTPLSVEESTTVTVTNSTETGVKKYDKETRLHTIYLVKEEPTGKDGAATIKWEYLEESRIMKTVQLTIEDNDKEKNPSGLNGLRFNTEKLGYTNLGFWIERTSQTEARINYIPYPKLEKLDMVYSLFKLSGDPNPDSGKAEEVKEELVGYSKDNENKYISIPFDEGRSNYYKIKTDIVGKQTISSQTLKYNAFEDTNIPPQTPQIEEVSNIYVTPALEKGGQPQAIVFDLEWRVPKSATTGGAIDVLLEAGDLYYEMFLYEKVEGLASERFYSKVFKVSKANEGIVASEYGGEAGRDGVKETSRYNPNKNTITMEKIELKGVESESKWNQLNEFPLRYEEAADYPKKDLITEAATLNFKAPNTYYITMRVVYDKNKEGEKLTISNESNRVSISIGETREVIPGIDIIESSNNTTDTKNISQSIRFKQSDLYRYYNKMLEPAHWYLWEDEKQQENQKYRRTYEIFLYQQNENKKEYSEADFKMTEFIEYNPKDSEKDSIDLTMSQKDKLRKGEIIPIKYVGVENSNYIDPSVIINNLDPNQVYYVQMRTRIDAKRDIDVKDMVYTDWSILSKIHTFTTFTKPLPPTPDEQVPPAPKDFLVEEKQPLDNTIATLGWTPPDYVFQDKESTMHYEIVRATDNRLKENELLRELSIEEILKTNRTIVGFKTKLGFIETIDTTTGSWIKLKPEQSSSQSRLKDINLSPNTNYYYYIRTIVVLKGEEVSSEWIMIPVTTKPVNKPSKLKVEHPDDYKYNTKNEVVISFLAPIPEGSKISEEYDFDIAIRGEKDEDYKLTYRKTRLTSKEEEKLIPTGYVHLVYKIEGLKPGSRYDIKVRTIDKTKEKLEGEEFPKSLYSDQVRYRTEYDEEDADKDNKYEEYLKKYDSEAEKLRRKPYWEVESDKYEKQYKYRKDYIEAELRINNRYELVTDKDVQALYYYFPANMIETVNRLGSMIEVRDKDTSITLRPYTLSNKTQEIEAAIKDIKNGKLKDYYIALEVRISNTSEKINGQVPVSPRILIDMELIELDEEDIFIEENIMDTLNKLIDKGRGHVISALERELDKGTIKEERLDSIINKEIEEIKEKHKEKVKNILKHEIEDKESIGKIDKSILITSNISSYSVSGYFQKRNWSPVYTFATTGGYGMEAEELGNYIFVSGSGNTTITPDIPEGQELVGKYNLTDFFDVDTRGLATAATKADIYGSLARVLGAKRHVNYMDYLQARGLQGISKANINQPIRQDEAIYLIMQGYEKIYFKSVNAIQIKNRQSVQNIGAFQSYHRPYIYAAVEIGVVVPVNNKVIPSQAMMAKDIINMLSEIVPK